MEFEQFTQKVNNVAMICSVKILIIMLCISCDKTESSFDTNQNLNKVIVYNLGSVIDITPNKLQELLLNDPKILLVDIRRTKELTGTYKMLENAIHIEDNLIFNNPDTLPANRSIVIMCETGYRSGKLSEFLKTQGRLIYNLRGGLKNYYKCLNGNIQNKTIDILETKQDFINDGGC